jgi:HK97 family phage portal protein
MFDSEFRPGLGGFMDRLRFAFSKATTGSDAPPLSDLQLPVSAMMRRIEANYTGGVEAKFEDMVKFGWRRNELIFSCISKTAKTASQIELKVYDKKTRAELPDHPLKKLIQAPNPEMTEYDFWSSVITYQKLAGRAIFEKERTNGGDVCRLWPLRPDWVSRKMLNAVQVDYYRYKPGGAEDYADLPPENVLFFRVWDPMGLFSSWPPVAVASRSGDVDNDATDLIKATFQEGGTPPIAIKVPGRLKEDQVTELRSRWHSRYGGWRKQIDPAILDSGADITKIGFTFKEMGFDALDARSEARICMVLDVPPILVGAKIGLDRATYSNYGEARLAWWQDSLTPLYADLLDVVINGLLPEFDDHDNITVAWDFSRVAAMQEDQNKRWERATKAWDSNAITLNEFRSELGWLPAPPELGDLRKTDLAAPAPPAPVAPSPTAGASHPRARLALDLTTLKLAGSNGHAHEEHKETVLSDTERMSMEKSLTADLVKYFKEQQARIEEAVRAATP